MSEQANSNVRIKTPEEIELEHQAATAALRNKIVQSELAAAKAKNSIDTLPADTEKAKLEIEKAKWEKQQAEIKAKKELFQGPEVKPPEGQITSHGDFIESTVLAFRNLTIAFEQVITKLETNAHFKDDAQFVFYNENDMASLEQFAAFMQDLHNLLSDFENANAKAAALPVHLELNMMEKSLFGVDSISTVAYSALYVASGILKSAASIIALFKTDTVYKNFDIAIDDAEIVALFKKNLRHKTWKVYAPHQFPMNLVTSTTESLVMQRFYKLKAEVGKAETHLDSIKPLLEQLNKASAESNDEAQRKKILKQMAPYQVTKTNLTTLINLFKELEHLLFTVDATSKLTPNTVILKAERLFNKLREPGIYSIQFITQQKGSNRITKNIWRNAKIEHSAGCSVSCLVYASDGELVFAESVQSYLSYKTSEGIYRHEKQY